MEITDCERRRVGSPARQRRDKAKPPLLIDSEPRPEVRLRPRPRLSQAAGPAEARPPLNDPETCQMPSRDSHRGPRQIRFNHTTPGRDARRVLGDKAKPLRIDPLGGFAVFSRNAGRLFW
jgi:hypothetical protein